MPAVKPVDPNTKIPNAVRRAAAAADELHKVSYSKTEGDPAPVANDNAPAPAAAPEVTPEPVAPNPDLTMTPSVTPPSNPAPAPTPAPAAAPEPNETVNWEHRYKSMEGRYKRAENDIRAMSDQIASMQALIANMQAQAPAEPTPPELQARSLLTPEEVNEYGSEFLGVVAKKAKEELTPEMAKLQKEIERLNKRLEGSQQSASARARAELEATLDEKIPNWRDINVAPEFHSWLALPDLYSGAIRHQLLTAAYEQNNTPRVLAFFKGFLSEEAATAPAPSEPAPAGATPSKIPLENFAAPGRAKTAAAPPSAPAEKPIFTRAYIAKFYADAAAGKFRGREAEKNRIEAQIFDAEREGRIR